jgi:hypothetical protein
VIQRKSCENKASSAGSYGKNGKFVPPMPKFAKPVMPALMLGCFFCLKFGEAEVQRFEVARALLNSILN